jgi:hypothetical protein
LPDSVPRKPPLRAVAGNGALLAAFVAVLLDLAGMAPHVSVWAAIFALYFAARARTIKRSGRIILAAAVVSVAGVWLATGQAYLGGLRGAGFLFVFLVVMQYMAELADRSPKISEAAEIIVSRPAGQRYLFVTFGTHVFALFLQIGAVILIMTLLASRVRDAGEATVRSLTVAGLRGFSCTAMWSPLSLGILIVFSNVTGVDYGRFALLGLGCAALFLLAGYWMERGRRARVAETVPITAREWIALARVVGLAALLVTGGLGWVAVFEVPLIEGMFSVVFILGVFWSALSAAGGHLSPADAAGIFSRAGSGLANEVAIISGATIIGALGSGLIGQWSGLEGVVSPAMAARPPEGGL